MTEADVREPRPRSRHWDLSRTARAAEGAARDRRHGPARRKEVGRDWVEECDFSNVDLKLLVPTALKAAAETLKEFPELNARLEGDEIVYLDRYDLGIAVQTDDGLVVPVVRGCDSASVDELAEEVKRLAEAARDGALKPEELRGSTFTVTSAGKLAGLPNPIMNHPGRDLSIGRSPSAPSCATASSRSPGPATSRSRSTTAWSTGPAPPSSAWHSSAGSKAPRNEKSPAGTGLFAYGRGSS